MTDWEKVRETQLARRAVESGKETTLKQRILANTASQEDIAEYAKQLGDAARASVLATGGEWAAKQYAAIDAQKAAEEARRERAFEQIAFNQRVATDVVWLASNVDLQTRERVNRAALAEVDRRREILDYFATTPEARRIVGENIRNQHMGLITPEQINREIQKQTSLENISLSLEGDKFRAKSNSEGHVQIWPGGLGGAGDGE